MIDAEQERLAKRTPSDHSLGCSREDQEWDLAPFGHKALLLPNDFGGVRGEVNSSSAVEVTDTAQDIQRDFYVERHLAQDQSRDDGGGGPVPRVQRILAIFKKGNSREKTGLN